MELFNTYTIKDIKLRKTINNLNNKLKIEQNIYLILINPELYTEEQKKIIKSYIEITSPEPSPNMLLLDSNIYSNELEDIFGLNQFQNINKRMDLIIHFYKKIPLNIIPINEDLLKIFENKNQEDLKDLCSNTETLSFKQLSIEKQYIEATLSINKEENILSKEEEKTLEEQLKNILVILGLMKIKIDNNIFKYINK